MEDTIDNKNKLLHFLESQRLLVLASQGNDLWVTNIFYGIDENFKIYFISNKETKHSEQISKNPEIAFSVAWYNNKDHTDRKAIQGKGKCRIANSEEEIKKGVELHNKYYPEFAERITVDWIKSNDNNSHVGIIEPTFIKFWNDELYGDNETEEFNF